MNVKCINSIGYRDLTKNKVYTVYEKDSYNFIIINNFGNLFFYPRDCFIYLD